MLQINKKEFEGRLASGRLYCAGGRVGESKRRDPNCEMTVLGLGFRHSPWRSSSISLHPQRASSDPHSSPAAGGGSFLPLLIPLHHNPCQPAATQQKSLKGQRALWRQLVWQVIKEIGRLFIWGIQYIKSFQ